MRRLCAALLCLAAGCGDESVPAPVPPVSETNSWRGSLSLEMRGSADVTLAAKPDGAVDVALALRDVDTRGLFDAATSLVASGRCEPFPETQSELFTATFPLAPSPSPESKCGAQPVVLALALHRRAPNARFGGSLTAYCGERAAGVPAFIFRLSGTLAPE